MRNNLKSLELTSLIITIILASYSGIGIYSILKICANDAYIAVLLALSLGIPSIILFLIIFNYEENLPLNLKIEKIFGNFLGKIINIFLIIMALIIGITNLYNLINFISIHYLSNTPHLIIGLIFILVIIYANLKGLTTICRLAFILLVINILLFIIPFIHLLPNANYSNLRPILSHGISNPLNAAFKIVLLNINNIFILNIIPKNRFKDKHKTSKYIIWAYIISIFLMFLIITMTITSLGIDLAMLYQYPEYIVLKKINLFNFLNRIENIVAIQWINEMFISICITIYFISNSINIKNNKKIPIIVFSLAILFITILVFKNNTQYNNFCFYTLPIIKTIIALIIVLVAATICLKKR